MKEKFINIYIYNHYKDNYIGNITSFNNMFLTTPYFYYRNNFKDIKQLKKNNLENIKNEIINSKYYFLLEKDWVVKNPEFLNENDLRKITKILKGSENDFYALNAYVIYYYNKWKLDLETCFNKLLSIEKNSPHILARYARYQASTLYKKYKNNKYLELWKKNILLAIKQFENRKSELPTFFYSWLWYIEHELWNYNKAIEIYEKVVKLNKKLWVEVPEPYVWKVFSLNKLWKYKESLDLWLLFEDNNILNEFNDKRDFRLYKVLSDNYHNLWEYKEFYKNLKITIEKFLEMFSFHFNNDIELNKKNDLIIFSNEIEKNKYNSFLEYNKNYIKDWIDNIIFSIAYLYKEKLLWNDIIFNDSRWIERLCFNYLQLIYDWKIK